jgi:hypothetical protein
VTAWQIRAPYSAAGMPKRAGTDFTPCARSAATSWQPKIRSKPPIHTPTARPSTTGCQAHDPVTASHAPMGPIAWARPRMACGKFVNRLP